MFSYAALRPLTPTRPLAALSFEYRGEGEAIRSLARLREKVGVRVQAWLNHVANEVPS